MRVSTKLNPLSNTNTACFSLTADIHPGTFPRVLELFAKRGLTPLKCHSSQNYAPEAQQVIDIQMAEMPLEFAHQVGASLRQICGVESVLVSAKANSL